MTTIEAAVPETISKTQAELLAVLRERFGLPEFRPGQERVIRALLERERRAGGVPHRRRDSLRFALPEWGLRGPVQIPP
jgi:superfamily II DNA helicase RecQ